MADCWRYLRQIEDAALSVPATDGATDRERVRRAWAWYAEQQIRKGWSLRKCLSHARALAKRKVR